jgi:hypothetical protein
MRACPVGGRPVVAAPGLLAYLGLPVYSIRLRRVNESVTWTILS